MGALRLEEGEVDKAAEVKLAEVLQQGVVVVAVSPHCNLLGSQALPARIQVDILAHNLPDNLVVPAGILVDNLVCMPVVAFSEALVVEEEAVVLQEVEVVA